MPQGGEGIRMTGVPVPGGTIVVNVGPNDATVEVSVSGSGTKVSHDVPGNKDTSITIPPVPPGTTVIIRVGDKNRQRRIVIIVVAPSP
jgi:hypothetical protein